MKTIYKYPLDIKGRQMVSMPKNSRILCVQAQNDRPCVWAIVDADEKEMQDVPFAIVGTGRDADAAHFWKYVGTVQLFGGSLVWHVFTY